MISINTRKFLAGLILGLILFSIFTVMYLENEDNSFYKIENKKQISYFIEPSSKNEQNRRGFYKQALIRDFEPGNYKVKIDSAGENITCVLISSREKQQLKFNDSVQLNLKIESSVWFGFMIEEPPEVSYTDEMKNKFNITFNKKDTSMKIPTKITLFITIVGGVTFAANEARIYRKKRQ